jgi:hypothetical protein
METNSTSNVGIQQKSLPNSTIVLILGIFSILGCCCYSFPGIISGIIALVLAAKDLELYTNHSEEYSLSSYNNLKAGRIMAIVGISLACLYFFFLIAYIILYGAFFSMANMF